MDGFPDEQVILISGVTVTVKVAHVRLCHSRRMVVRACMREIGPLSAIGPGSCQWQRHRFRRRWRRRGEMVFDAHDRAFAVFPGTCTRGIHDIEPWKRLPIVSPSVQDRWRGGQVDNQVGLVRERMFTPRVRVSSLEELNALLMDRCLAHAKAHRHPGQTGRTIWQMFEVQGARRHRFEAAPLRRPHPVPCVGPCDGCHSVPAHSTRVLEPMANKVSHIQDLHGAVRQ